MLSTVMLCVAARTAWVRSVNTANALRIVTTGKFIAPVGYVPMSTLLYFKCFSNRIQLINRKKIIRQGITCNNPSIIHAFHNSQDISIIINESEDRMFIVKCMQVYDIPLCVLLKSHPDLLHVYRVNNKLLRMVVDGCNDQLVLSYYRSNVHFITLDTELQCIKHLQLVRKNQLITDILSHSMCEHFRCEHQIIELNLIQKRIPNK